ncbi:hypothetical protein OHB39_20675 [Streptomyces sp. NBC_00047]|uniref:HoxN/HupN/NixA family nickel/cobalt transporter n=1 Tax=Streptomyces sp. NBC_00047 TaxID=2975627 RepID=UPI002250C015|nr:hypothetical protein [Streptomyces sp. NBC_00047]MCX5609979.1 hypothetical protein [Streptomyces sp. NBC_00047]
MRSLRTGVLLLLAAVPALLLGSAGTAQAHPFGTPPVVKVEAAGTAVDVFWSAQWDDVAVLEKQSGGDEAAYLSSHIVVRQDGHPCRVDRADGMKLHFVCERTVERIDLTVTALTDADPAYRTLSVTGTGSGGLHTAQEPTRTLTLTPSGAGAAAGSSAASGPGAWTTDLAALLDHGAALPLALLVAAAVGALHACAPGHGKSLAAGYLVGGRGRARDAVWLGGIVAVMHTLSVATLAVGWWLAANSTPDIAALTGWLQLIAALVVAGAGVSLLLRHLRHRQHHHSDHDHDHDHDHGHDHGHRHDHDYDHGHSHHIPDAPSLLTWRGLVLLGASGGAPYVPSRLPALAGRRRQLHSPRYGRARDGAPTGIRPCRPLAGEPLRPPGSGPRFGRGDRA